MKFDALVRAACDELRRQNPKAEQFVEGRVTIVATFADDGVELNVNRLVEVVLDELYGGFGALGEIEP